MLSAGLLQTEGIDADKQIKQAGFKKWKVYAKSPFGSVASVVEYLGCYTHQVAITKHRILSEYSVTFKYKDYDDGNKQKIGSLSIAEFLRRFELHFYPVAMLKSGTMAFYKTMVKRPGSMLFAKPWSCHHYHPRYRSR